MDEGKPLGLCFRKYHQNMLDFRQQANVAPVFADPFRIDELFLFGFEHLVGCSNGAITDTSYDGDFFGRLRLFEEMGDKVDASRSGREWRTAGERANVAHLFRQLLSDVHECKRQ